MNGNISEWLKAMYDAEIAETKGSISNERLWANGSPDEQTAQMHLDNIEELERYIETLERLKRAVDE